MGSSIEQQEGPSMTPVSTSKSRRCRPLGPALALAWMLAACGGGGGGDDGGNGNDGDDDGGGTPSYTLSGTLSIIESSAVDSDLNDPNQTGYQRNDNTESATWQPQSITTPVLLTGTVNTVGTGPAGRNQTLGDRDDYFLVELAAGQVVELEFASDPGDSDVDLFVYDAEGNQVGVSDGTDSRYECVTITRAGTYYVNPYAYINASIYSLRIGAPGTGSSCGNATAALDSAALLAREHASGSPKRPSTAALADHRGLLARAGVSLETVIGAGPQKLRLPQGPSARRAGLDLLRGGGRSSALDSAQHKSALAAGGAASSALSRIESLATTLRYAKVLRASGSYAYVEPDWTLRRTATIGSFPPNDRYYGYQRWHYEQIRLPEAINRINALTSPPIQRPLVAVIDSGVVLSHPDLAPQLDSNGRSFVGGVSTASGDDQSSAADNSVFHGTHVAGTIAASTFDGVGAAGVAPMAQILPLNVFGSGEGASTSDIANAILYAARLGNSSGTLPGRRADVINMSLGGGGSCSSAFQQAITAARGAGVIVVAATGNESATTVGQPANCTGVIAVSATQPNKGIAPYSNTGSAVRVAAPGGNTGQSTTGNGQPDGVFSTMASFDTSGSRIHTLGFLQGTSMASPHVAGVMALMRYVHPGLAVEEVDSLFANGSLTDDLGSTGRDTRYGWGLINADKAVVAALSLVGTVPPAPAGEVMAEPSSLDFGSFQTSGTLTLSLNGSSSERVTAVTSSNAALTVSAGSSVGSNGLGSYNLSVNRAALAHGSHYLTLTVSVSGGGRSSFTVPVAITKTAAGTVRAGGFGPVYVLLQDPDDDSYQLTVQATYSELTGAYRWSAAGYARSKLQVIAGTDLDNDGYICQRGEACGGYPVLEAVLDSQHVLLSGNRSDLDFQVAPLSDISALSTRKPSDRGGYHRRAPSAAP